MTFDRTRNNPDDPRFPSSNDLWVVSCYFNPERYSSKRRNVDLFRYQLERQGVPHRIVECAFRRAAFELPSDSSVLRISADDVMWQKERLLNCAIESLPSSCTKVAWLDCDVLFEDDDWHRKVSEALEHHSVLQPYSWSVRLPQGHTSFRGQGFESASFAWISQTLSLNERQHYKDHGRTGFAWAGRRDWIDRHGLYDACVMGGADHLMAHVFDGNLKSPCLKAFSGERRALHTHFLEWVEAIQPYISSGGLGVVSGRLLHLWHGDTANRAYGSRQKVLTRAHFDPKNDIRISSTGAWAWASSKPDLHRDVARYFADRKEDDCTSGASSFGAKRSAKNTFRQVDALQPTAQATFGASIAHPASSNPHLDNAAIYEWFAWKGYLLQRILPNASRITAAPLESLEEILSRIPNNIRLFAFHLNCTETSRFPLCRMDLCNSLELRGIRLLNSNAQDISKRTLQQTLNYLGLPSVATTAHDGKPSDVLIVKTNRNYAGFGEKQLSENERFAMKLDGDCPLETVSDYRITRRTDIPGHWWSDTTLAIERYISNQGGIKHRSYFAGAHCVIITTSAAHLVMRRNTARTQNVCYATENDLMLGQAPGFSNVLQRAIWKLIQYLRMDFGAIDILEDDEGTPFIVDVNTTSYGNALDDAMIGHLRTGLSLRLDMSEHER